MTLYVEDMSCMHCVKRITTALKDAGFKKIKTNLETKEVSFVSKKEPIETAIKAIESIGYHVNQS